MLAVEPWLVVFDLDGTLIDSSLDLCLAVNAAMAHVDAPLLPHPTITSFIGDGAATLIRRALGLPRGVASDDAAQQPRAQAALTHFLDFYRKHKLDNTRLYDGVLTALDTLQRGSPELRMAVLTNKPVGPAREICTALGLDPYLFAVYGGNSFPSKKPDPAGLQTLMHEAANLRTSSTGNPAELTPVGVVMVGDSDVDVLTARAAGATSIGCSYGLAPDSLAFVPPDYMCHSPSEWPQLLRAAV